MACFLHAERLAVGNDDNSVMQKSVEHADCRRVLGQEPAPLVEGPVAADPERDALVGRRHEPEQQLCTGVVERGEAKPVDSCRRPYRSTYADSATIPTTQTPGP